MQYILTCIGMLLLMATQAARAEPIEFGILPVLSTRSIITLYDPLREYLERRLGLHVILATAPDYRTYIARTQNREFRYLMTAPHFARLAQLESGYRPMVRVKHEQLALLLTDKATGVANLAALRGKIIATPDSLAVVTLMGMEMLRAASLSLGKDVTLRAFPSFNSALIALRNGEVAAAFSSPVALTQMPEDQRRGLITLATSQPQLPVCYLANPSAPPSEVAAMTHALLEFEATPEGQAFFKKTGYEGFRALQEVDLRTMDRYVKEIKKRL
ncbi:MAG: PhnD/SsuA/transferrin family substrate-binding protein [Pseudomonadota bacterium]